MVYLIKILPGNLPKWKNQSIPTIPGSYVIGISSPFCGDAALHICFRSREHKKRRCPFASTPLRLPVLRGNQAAVGVGGFRNQPLGVILLIGTLLWNNIKMISCIYNIYIYMSYLYLELYVYLFLTICSGGYLCQSLCAAGRQSKSSTPKIKWSSQSLHPQRMEHAIYLLSSV